MEYEDVFARRSRATAASMCIELLDDHFSGAQTAIDARMFRQLDQGVEVSPQAALQFIYEKHAHWRLCKKLEQTLRSGQTANTTLAPLLNPIPTPEGASYG